MSNIGFYILTNRSTGHFYVGSSSRLSQRMYQHRWALQNGRHHAVRLQEGFTSWGDINIEIFPALTTESAKAGEQKLLDEHLSNPLCCNRAPSAFDPTQGVITNEMRIRTIGFALAARLSRPVSNETREAMSRSHMGMTRSDETRDAISASKSSAVILDGVEYSSILIASRELNLNTNTIRSRLRSTSPRYKDWRYV